MGRQMGRPAGRVEELRACGRPGVYGDAANEAILEQVGLEQALGLVLLSSSTGRATRPGVGEAGRFAEARGTAPVAHWGRPP